MQSCLLYCTISRAIRERTRQYISILLMAMAEGSDSSSGSRAPRKKRAWRQPRQPATPAAALIEESKEKAPKAIKLTREVSGSSSRALSSSLADSKEQQAAVREPVGQGAVENKGKPDGQHQCDEVTDERMEEKSLLTINGSIMEGGGQILRISMTLSCLLTQPIHIHHIRGGRSKPGLRPQHMTGLRLLADLCGGSLEGANVGSSEVTFHPGALAGGDFVADTKTAGSICLLLQAALPVLIFTPGSSRVTLKGGTNADMAPPIDYFQNVFFNIASKFGLTFDCQLKRRGFYPKGRGEVVYCCSPVKGLSPITMIDRGCLKEVHIHAYVAGTLPRKVGHTMIQSAREVLQLYLSTLEEEGKDVHIKTNMIAETQNSAFGNGSGIIVWATTSTGCILAGSANGKKDESAEVTGRMAAEELVRDLSAGGCVDHYLQDQLIVLMCLASGHSTLKTGPLTLHTKTAMHIAEIMTHGKIKFQVEERQDGSCDISCEGLGLTQL